MNTQEVRIVELEPLHVAYALGFGQEPELQALDKLMAWVSEQGLLESPEKPRFFGFNNPNPSPGSPNYGYEVWVTVGPDVEPEGEIGLKDFPGGLYAVTRFKGVAGPEITRVWERLVEWAEKSEYRPARHQWLEEHWADKLGEDCELDLYMPIAR